MPVLSKTGPSTSGYQSPWEQLLKAHATREPPMNSTVIQGPTTSAATASSSSKTTLTDFGLQRSTQMSQQPQPNGTSGPSSTNLGPQPRGPARQREVSRSTISAQAKRQSLHPPPLLNRSTAFTFSSQLPTREGYPAQRAPPSEHNPQPVRVVKPAYCSCSRGVVKGVSGE